MIQTKLIRQTVKSLQNQIGETEESESTFKQRLGKSATLENSNFQQMQSKDERQQEEKQIRNKQKHEQFDLHLRYYRNHQICREKSREISEISWK